MNNNNFAPDPYNAFSSSPNLHAPLSSPAIPSGSPFPGGSPTMQPMIPSTKAGGRRYVNTFSPSPTQANSRLSQSSPVLPTMFTPTPSTGDLNSSANIPPVWDNPFPSS